jgi:hypothetical protein
MFVDWVMVVVEEKMMPLTCREVAAFQKMENVVTWLVDLHRLVLEHCL